MAIINITSTDLASAKFSLGSANFTYEGVGTWYELEDRGRKYHPMWPGKYYRGNLVLEGNRELMRNAMLTFTDILLDGVHWLRLTIDTANYQVRQMGSIAVEMDTLTNNKATIPVELRRVA